MIDYENLSAEEEQELVNDLKRKFANVVIDQGVIPKCFVVYALLELARQMSIPDDQLFIDAANEVDNMFLPNFVRFINY